MQHQMIETRVCIDDTLGPFDCKLDPTNRWNGWLSPNFSLETARQLSAQTLRMADEYGWDCADTIHVIDGRADSPDTVHVIDSGRTHEINENGDTAPVAFAVRIPWRKLGRGGQATITDATPAVRKAARRCKPGGRGALRAVVVHARWTYMADEGCDSANVVAPNAQGLYPIGGWEWTWHFATWWCACGEGMDWHEAECLCGLNRDNQPPLAEATARRIAAILRTLAPQATSALADFGSGLARVSEVFAGDVEIDTADETGPFDTETLGAADEVLRQAVDMADSLNELVATWEHVPHERTAQLYRITFPAAGQ